MNVGWHEYKKEKLNLVVLLSWCFIIKLAELKENDIYESVARRI